MCECRRPNHHHESCKDGVGNASALSEACIDDAARYQLPSLRTHEIGELEADLFNCVSSVKQPDKKRDDDKQWRNRENCTICQRAALFESSGFVPVSYTHLRAHETPEHLVCR